MWHIDLLWTPATLNLYLNLAKGILMEFQPAYTPLASTILRSLKEYSRVEEVTVHGGDHWNASVLALAELRSLQRVDFAGSGLAELSDENFPRMPNLVYLDLSNNKFSSVPIGIRTLRSLRTLNVSSNPLETMQFAPILRSLQQLEVLNVSRIPLESLDTLILDEGVENLDDNGTMIGDKWRVLDASACNLSDVNSTATRILFRRLRNLHELILADNPLTTVPHDFLVNIRELQ
ncbi:Protein flightless-1, partial [Gryllus bimaculatus]